MKVTPIKTSQIRAKEQGLVAILDEFLRHIPEGSIVVITSKIVSLCENRVVPIGQVAKEDLIQRESDFYLDEVPGKYGIRFTITKNTLIPTAGIDESNADEHYVLWPENPQKTANEVRKYLSEKFNVRKVGVIITDSTCAPLRWGTSGISVAHSGFLASNDYVGKKDLFGRSFKVSRSNVAGGLAAAAVVAMGEGAEQTPICLVENVPFVQFQERNPNTKEIAELNIALEDDLFEPFLSKVKWQKGQR